MVLCGSQIVPGNTRGTNRLLMHNLTMEIKKTSPRGILKQFSLMRIHKIILVIHRH